VPNQTWDPKTASWKAEPGGAAGLSSKEISPKRARDDRAGGGVDRKLDFNGKLDRKIDRKIDFVRGLDTDHLGPATRKALEKLGARGRARSHCRVVLPLTRVAPDSLR
jgi:hypothetical protein